MNQPTHITKLFSSKRYEETQQGNVPAPFVTEEVVQEDGPPANIFDQEGEGKGFRTVGRWGAILILITNQVGLGILSLPSTLHVLGIVPAVIAIIGFAVLSTYTAYELLQFYRRYPSVVNIVDMARIMGGPPFEAFMGVCVLLKILLTCSSTIVTLSVAFNTMSRHAMCTAGWIGISALACWMLCLPRTFKFVSHMGIPCTISILAAVLIVIIGLGVSDPRGVPSDHFDKEIKIVGSPTFKAGLRACLQICYAFAGNVAFVSYMAEMKDASKDFLPALIALQIFAVPLYLLVALGIYCMAGQYTRSPALGSAPETVAKVAYGVVLPAVLGTGLVFGHAAVKYLFVMIMRALNSTKEVTDQSLKAWSVWIGSATAFWATAFVIANAIPIFESILAISSATFVAWFTFGISAIFWFYLNWGGLTKTPAKIALTVLNTGLILLSIFMNAAGVWAAISGLIDIFHSDDSKIRGAFTCADNSIF